MNKQQEKNTTINTFIKKFKRRTKKNVVDKYYTENPVRGNSFKNAKESRARVDTYIDLIPLKETYLQLRTKDRYT